MKYVFEGEDLSNVLRENEIRIKRGTLKVYPLDEETPEDPVDDPKEVADAIHAAEDMGFEGGMLVTVPIPVEWSMDADYINGAIDKALT